MGHKKGITPSLASRRTPSLFSKGLAGPEYSGERDPKFVKPAPPTRDSGIGQKPCKPIVHARLSVLPRSIRPEKFGAPVTAPGRGGKSAL